MADTRTVKSNLAYTGTPRHLLVFMDGTWNDENGRDNDGVTTNIYKLFRVLKGRLTQKSIPHIIEHEEHLALYFRGIGNDDDSSMLGSFYYGVFGGSEKRIRDHAYVSIVEHYRKGDRISIFGFSRGAASARLLASDLKKEGVAKFITIHSKREKNKSTGVRELVYKKYSKISTIREVAVAVRFLGIFDTVGAFGIPVEIGFGFQKINLFKDLTVSANVKTVVHCVSIDENRKPFIPTLCNQARNVSEVWFAGVHADIGGGYGHPQLGRIPLSYMLGRLDKTFSNNRVAFDKVKLSQLTDYNLGVDEFHLHYHGDGIVKKRRDIVVLKDGENSGNKPAIHSSVFNLMDSKKLILSTTFDGFAKIEAIRYMPKSITGLMGNFALIE
ncbi:MAG: DUF2235 domain-containing protein [Pseudohongiellaceae bacterium]